MRFSLLKPEKFLANGDELVNFTRYYISVRLVVSIHMGLEDLRKVDAISTTGTNVDVCRLMI